MDTAAHVAVEPAASAFDAVDAAKTLNVTVDLWPVRGGTQSVAAERRRRPRPAAVLHSGASRRGCTWWPLTQQASRG